MDALAVMPSWISIGSQLVATLIMILYIKKKTYKMYQDYMAKRTDFVNSAIQQASDNQLDSKKVLEELQFEKAEIKNTKKNLYNEVVAQGNVEKEAILNDAKVRARGILEKASLEVESQKQHVSAEISADILDYATLVAAKFLQNGISKADEEALINQALFEVNNENK